MKPIKPGSTNGKISDFFTKCSQKRKLSEPSTSEEHVLTSINNLTESQTQQINHKSSAKKAKCNENYFSELNLQKTPEKCIKSLCSSKSPSSKTPKDNRVLVNKNKKSATPKKLFEKSPRKLDEFNVQILENFVKVTPSKFNRLNGEESTPTKINAVQSFIVNYLSPSSSETVNPQNRTKTPKKVSLNFNNDTITEKNDIFEYEDGFNELMDDFDDAIFLINDQDTLNLENQRCTIVQVTKNTTNVILRLKANDKFANCSIEEFWSNNEFKINAVVLIHAYKRENNWFVNNTQGFIIYEPDLLISCTSLVRNLFCKRASIFSEHFQGFESGNKALLIGTLVHSLFQTALKQKMRTMTELENCLEDTLREREVLRKCYEGNFTIADIQTEIKEIYVPRIYDFLKQYVTSECKPNLENWQGKVASITDIEDNLWCPSLGLKGKIDVTIKSAENEIIPLELKTGRASISLEHRAQVMLYIMMMNKLGYKVSTGLLLYLKEGVLKDFVISEREQRDLMILRNEFTFFLTQKVEKVEDKIVKVKLPEPINNRACSRCSYNVICTSLLRHENYDYGNNKLKEIEKEVTAHLSDEHINYFVHWTNLMHLEMQSKGVSKNLSEIITVQPETREKNGRCLINLKISSIVPENNGLFKHVFIKNTSKETCKKFLTCGITENNYIVVSTETRIAVAMGFVREITINSISVSLDRNLNNKFKDKLFHLDTYDSTGVYSFNFNSVAILLENTERAKQLRNIIINKSPPVFAQKLPAIIAKQGKEILKKLNRVQQRAVLTALSSQDFVLIKGMPGTGKTSTIVALIQLLLILKKTVLITSHTHAAVDNVCLRLKQVNIDFIRLGANSKIDNRLQEQSENNLLQNCQSLEELDDIYKKYNVIAVTCLGSGHPMLSKREIDVCIVDESTQVLQATIIRPISLAKSFILIGDPDQLSPLVLNQEALAAGMGESLFEHLDRSHPEATVILTLNYRMNKIITNLANSLTYEGKLLPANETVAQAHLKLNSKTIENESSWLVQALNCQLENSVQFIDTGPVWKFPQFPDWYSNKIETKISNLVNVYELGIVVTLVKNLICGGLADTDIGVMATYTAQVAELSAAFEKYNVHVNTVDQFQGQDKSVIIYSCTKSKDMSLRLNDLKFDILEDKRRLTVAITRAKHKLLLIGDKSTLEHYSTFATMFKHIPTNQIITLNEIEHKKIACFLNNIK